MAPKRTFDSLPPEMVNKIVSCLSTEPSGPLSDYHVPHRTTPVAMTNGQDYHQSKKNFCNLCLVSKQLLGIARPHLYYHVRIYHHRKLFPLFRTMILVPALADRIQRLEVFINIEEQRGPNFHPVLESNPLQAMQYYHGGNAAPGGRHILEVIGQRLGMVFMGDVVFNQNALLAMPGPSGIIFLGILGLATNLRSLLVEHHDWAWKLGHGTTAQFDGILQNLIAASLHNRDGGPLRRLNALQFRTFDGNAFFYVPPDVPYWISCLARLPNVTTLEIAGLCNPTLAHPTALPQPAAAQQPQQQQQQQLLPNSLYGILLSPNPNNLTRLELTFDMYSSIPVKQQLAQCLLMLRPTLRHLSVTFQGVINSHNYLVVNSMLPTHGPIMSDDRIDTLPLLDNLEHIEVDLHSLFGWIRLWTASPQDIQAQVPSRVGQADLLRQTIPNGAGTRLRVLHLIECWTDINIYLNLGAPQSAYGPTYLSSTSLAQANLGVGPAAGQGDLDLYGEARRKIRSNVLMDLGLMLEQGLLPKLKKFVYTPITYGRWQFDPRFDDYLLGLFPKFRALGVEMEVVYAGQLARVCQ